jgi:uncharacterized protein YbjQ (UPF0145 family)
LGLVKGNSIRAGNIGKDIMAKLRTIFEGELFEYTKLPVETREQAIDRLISSAKKMGADGIVGLRISTSTIMKGTSELIAYGTAVKLEKKYNY